MNKARADTSPRPGAPFRILAWPARNTANPHVRRVFEQIDAANENVEISDFDPRSNWWNKPDVVHIHWPERASDPSNIVAAVAKSFLVLAHFVIWRVRRVAVVWTVHNLRGHDQVHPILERLVKRSLLALCTGVIHLSEAGKAQAETVYPTLPEKMSTVISLPVVIQTVTRERRRRSSDILVVVAFGRMRSYKNTPHLAKTFASLGSDHPSRLIIVGPPDDKTVVAELEALSGDPRIHLDIRWLADHELATVLSSADMVIMPYRAFLNSGVIIDALATGLPTAVTRSPVTEELADQVGHEWLRLIESNLSPQELTDAIDWARHERLDQPDLDRNTLTRVSDETLNFLRSVAS